MVGVRGMPERDIGSLGVMGWGPGPVQKFCTVTAAAVRHPGGTGRRRFEYMQTCVTLHPNLRVS